ncbi:MAG: HNH endonuclease [Candidatus Omnitrophota bacterium]
MGIKINYRKIAFEAYDPVCAHCGFGVPAVLEVAHLDGNRTNNDPANLAILCPNCHKMHDLDLISTETIIEMRDRPKIVKWSKRMKDAGKKAALKRKRCATARKAVETRRRRKEESRLAASANECTTKTQGVGDVDER